VVVGVVVVVGVGVVVGVCIEFLRLLSRGPPARSLSRPVAERFREDSKSVDRPEDCRPFLRGG